jgi:hypothetical protein
MIEFIMQYLFTPVVTLLGIVITAIVTVTAKNKEIEHLENSYCKKALDKLGNADGIRIDDAIGVRGGENSLRIRIDEINDRGKRDELVRAAIQSVSGDKAVDYIVRFAEEFAKQAERLGSIEQELVRAKTDISRLETKNAALAGQLKYYEQQNANRSFRQRLDNAKDAKDAKRQNSEPTENSGEPPFHR